MLNVPSTLVAEPEGIAFATAASSVPALINVAPLYELLAPLIVIWPVPFFVKLPVPEIVPVIPKI